MLEQAVRGPHHQRGDCERGDRVGPIEACRDDDEAGDESAGERVQIGEEMTEAAFDRHVPTVGLRELPRRDEVHDETSERDDDDRPAADLRGLDEAPDGGVDDERREDE